MKLASFSASSAACYESCPARWRATYGNGRIPEVSGSAANLGTVCHAVFEAWVRNGHYKTAEPATTMAIATTLYDEMYWQHFADRSRYGEGWALVQKWLERQVWTDREVLMIEEKLNFPLETSRGTVPFNFICDRVDRRANGDVEVIDYKSVSFPVQPADLKDRIQARAYAAAAHRLYPDAKRIWVTFDLLRYEPVGVVFTAEEGADTERYLLGLAERILADEDAPETINDECRWCIRRNVCDTLARSVAVTGELITDPIVAAARRYELDCTRRAIDAQVAELDSVVLKHLAEIDGASYEAGGFDVTAFSGTRRSAKAADVAAVIGSDAAIGMSDIRISELDAYMKCVDDYEVLSLLRQSIKRNMTAASVRVKARKPPKAS